MPIPLDKLGPVIREARRRLKITQAELAEFLEAKQSAISMFENGQAHKLGRPKVEKAAARLGVDLETGEIQKQQVAPPTARCAKYCPRAECPMSVPFAVGEDLVFWPTFQHGDASTDDYCRACATLLSDSCSNPDCGTPAVKGRNNCPRCGAYYVVLSFDIEGSAHEWAERKRNEIEQTHKVSQMNTSGSW